MLFHQAVSPLGVSTRQSRPLAMFLFSSQHPVDIFGKSLAAYFRTSISQLSISVKVDLEPLKINAPDIGERKTFFQAYYGKWKPGNGFHNRLSHNAGRKTCLFVPILNIDFTPISMTARELGSREAILVGLSNLKKQ